MDKEFTVSRRTNVITLGDSVYHTIVENDTPVITSVGPDSIGQMTKALARARTKLLARGIEIVWFSYFEDGVGRNDNKPITLIKTKIIVHRR